MSIPASSSGRGCAAGYNEPVTEDQVLRAEAIADNVYHYNVRVAARPFADIVYRTSDQEHDRLHHVFRWVPVDAGPYQVVFQIGFPVRNEDNIPDQIFYDLDRHVHHVGRPVSPNRRQPSAFVATTFDSRWRPNVEPGTEFVYRYEIYAPGGIWVEETLGDRLRPDLRSQNEIAFAGGIAPQYIRAVQRFRVIRNARMPRYSRLERVDNVITINGNFRPHPPMVINIRLPVYYHVDEDEDGRRRRVPLTRAIYYPDQHDRKKRQVFTDSNNAVDWYARQVTDIETYINAAFRSSRTNEAYIFLNNEYLLLNYAPGTTDDWVVNGPLLICDGYPSLAGTVFVEWGIDCAFGSHDTDKAFIFSGNICAYIDYAPGTTNDKIIEGPMTIAKMFPFFKGTVFEGGIDAAFESSTKYEAYLFKGNQYALINYHTPKLIAIRPITQGFYGLRNTIFERGIDAAFASHRYKEAYLFKGDSYALIDFAPGSTDDKILGGVKKILPNWPSLRNILPRKNRGLDITSTTAAPAPPVHDDL